jgi:hypothetical protein
MMSGSHGRSIGACCPVFQFHPSETMSVRRSPKIAKTTRRQHVPPKHSLAGTTGRHLKWVEQWVEHLHVLRFSFDRGGCSTQKPTSIGRGVPVGTKGLDRKAERGEFCRHSMAMRAMMETEDE